LIVKEIFDPQNLDIQGTQESCKSDDYDNDVKVFYREESKFNHSSKESLKDNFLDTKIYQPQNQK